MPRETQTRQALVAFRKRTAQQLGLKTYSQSKTAALLGIPLQTLQNWEAGRNEPRGFTAKALMDKISEPTKTN